MAKKTAPKYKVKTYNFFLIVGVLLGMIAGVYMVKLFGGDDTTTSNTAPLVSLGALEYDFANGKATKRSNPAVSSLKAFLTDKAAKDCISLEPTQYQVIAATKDVSQVLIGYGCGDSSAHMFAQRTGNEWRFVSPTNHFGTLYGLPECGYVKGNGISRQIAPVCYTVDGADLKYHVR